MEAGFSVCNIVSWFAMSCFKALSSAFGTALTFNTDFTNKDCM